MTEYELDALILAPQGDLHARAVQREISLRGGTCLILDTLCFPVEMLLSFSSNRGSPIVHLTSESREVGWTLGPETGVWWRRPKGFATGGMFGHPGILSFVIGECAAAFLGSLASCCRRFINPISAHHSTTKLYELRVAADVGLKTPDTLVTTDKNRAIDFIAHQEKRYIYKTFTGGHRLGGLETRLFETQEDIEELWRLRYCPVIIQEYVPASADLRVTVIGGEVFCAAAKVDRDARCVDGRLGRTGKVVPHSLPSTDIERLLRLTYALGLTYAAIDMRLTEDGELVFLEVNPDGQYLWQEIEAGFPISSAIGCLLVPDAIVAKRSVDFRAEGRQGLHWEISSSSRHESSHSTRCSANCPVRQAEPTGSRVE